MFLDFVDTQKYWSTINIAHASVLGPALLYSGWKLLNNQALPGALKQALPYVGALVIGYHSLRAYHKFQAGEHPSVDYGLQVNLAHLLFIGPLVAWVGYKLSNGRVATQLEKYLFLILGASATVYHALKAYNNYV